MLQFRGILFNEDAKTSGFVGRVSIGNGIRRFPKPRPVSVSVRCSESVAQQSVLLKDDAQERNKQQKKATVLVLGGTGRVGGSTVRALAECSSPAIQVVIGGRNRDKGEALAAEVGDGTSFAQFDFNNAEQLMTALEGADLVVHAAGPFQRAGQCTVLEAAIATKTPYIDVCDDSDYSKLAKSYFEKAVAANIPAITTAGIYPGVSNIMAAELIRLNLSTTSESKPSRIRYSYYTAGSGGAGPTILATSYLLLGEEVEVYQNGEMLRLKPYSGVRTVDFGKGLGKKSVYLLNLPEVASTYEHLGVPSVSARFGTDPPIWNWAMTAIARFVPADFLRDRDKVQSLVRMSDPLVRVVDGLVGEKVSMRVDLECKDGRKAVGVYTHKKLSICVGESVAAFAIALLEGSTRPGVWFPEEEGGITVDARPKLLERAAKGTSNFVMNKSPWMIEKSPKEIGFGMYID